MGYNSIELYSACCEQNITSLLAPDEPKEAVTGVRTSRLVSLQKEIPCLAPHNFSQGLHRLQNQ
jgi:hypothetical protein